MSRSQFSNLKQKAKKLRGIGKTYSEINDSLGVDVPKSTLSLWFKNVRLSKKIGTKLKEAQNLKINQGLERAMKIRRESRENYLSNLIEKNKYLADLLENKNVAKIVLVSLYLGEGSKNPKRGSVMFGNSDPRVIKLFLNLIRKCYKINESKFRCTVQCRAGQNIKELERFWQNVTKIPTDQFYGSRIDLRTVGQKLKKPEYKGVCRIDYFSADMLNDILKAIEVIAGR